MKASIVYNSSFSAFSFFFSASLFFRNSATLGTSSFQNAIFFGLYLRSTLGFKSRTRYDCSCSVYVGHVTNARPEAGGVGDLIEKTIHKKKLLNRKLKVHLTPKYFFFAEITESLHLFKTHCIFFTQPWLFMVFSMVFLAIICDTTDLVRGVGLFMM